MFALIEAKKEFLFLSYFLIRLWVPFPDEAFKMPLPVGNVHKRPGLKIRPAKFNLHCAVSPPPQFFVGPTVPKIPPFNFCLFSPSKKSCIRFLFKKFENHTHELKVPKSARPNEGKRKCCLISVKSHLCERALSSRLFERERRKREEKNRKKKAIAAGKKEKKFVFPKVSHK